MVTADDSWSRKRAAMALSQTASLSLSLSLSLSETRSMTPASDGLISLYEGDSIDVLKTIPNGTYSAVVTDPPYGLSAAPDPVDVLVQWLLSGDFARTGGRKKAPPPGLSELAARFVNTKGGGGFLGHHWDSFVPSPILWREVFRTCKPGAIALVFASTRTYHWMVLGMLLAGFECLDTIGWVQAESMPHAGTIDKRIDARLGAIRPVTGEHPSPSRTRSDHPTPIGPISSATVPLTSPGSPEAEAWAGWSTELCGAIEPIAVMRRPCEGTATSNVLKHGCGAMNIGACKIDIDPHDPINGVDGERLTGVSEDGGRWPKNIMLDEVVADLLDQQVGERKSGSRRAGVRSGMGYHGADGDGGPAIEGSRGGPSRYFWVGPQATEDDVLLPIHYFPKVRFTEREVGLPAGLVSNHPTVKPQALMQRLCRLVGHPRGRILDPFAGTGTTLRAARAEGLSCDGVERDPEYARLARHRAGVALLRDYRGLAPHRLPTDPRSFLAEWLLDNI